MQMRNKSDRAAEPQYKNVLSQFLKATSHTIVLLQFTATNWGKKINYFLHLLPI